MILLPSMDCHPAAPAMKLSTGAMAVTAATAAGAAAAVWILTARLRNQSAPRSPRDAPEPPQRPAYVVLDLPTRQYTPANPRWLVQAASSSLSPQPQDPRCPLLSTLKDIPVPELGTKECRSSLYCLDPGVTYLNHGSYGATFRYCLDVQSWYRGLMEAQPVKFMETVALQDLTNALRHAATFLSARSPAELLPVTNATSACNTVITSALQPEAPHPHHPALATAATQLRPWTWGGLWRAVLGGRRRPPALPPVVLITSLTYPAVKSTVVRQAALAGASVVVVQLGLPELTQPGKALQAVQRAASDFSGRIVLAVLDHVVSFPPVVLPVKEMVLACKQAGALVLVDGAHAAGYIPHLDVPALGADFYTCNLHKWCCTPKGTAVLWASSQPTGLRQPGHTASNPGTAGAAAAAAAGPALSPTGGSGGGSALDLLRPPLTSHGFGLGARAEFLWQGTQDLSGWLAVPAALGLMERLGGAGVAEHNARAVRAAASLLRRRWGQELLVLGALAGSSSDQILQVDRPEGPGSCPEAGQVYDSAVGCMLAVELPALAGAPQPPTVDFAIHVHDVLRERHSIEVPVACMEGRLWVRISAQVYNTASDYERLADAIDGLRPLGSEGSPGESRVQG